MSTVENITPRYRECTVHHVHCTERVLSFSFCRQYARTYRNMALTGIPVLFIPGNAGSHRQGNLESRACHPGDHYWNYFLVHYLKVKSLQLTWRSGTRRWNLRVPDLQMSCRDLTPCQGTRIEAPCIGSQMTCLIAKNWSRWSQSIVVDCEYYYNMTVDLGGKFCHSSRLN